MKKMLLVMLAIVSASFMNVSAQELEVLKPKAGSFSLEVGFSPLSLGDNGASVHLPMGNLTGIYSISDKWGVRLALGFSSIKGKWDNGEEDEELFESNSYTQTVFSFAPGFTYSFKGTRRLAPYIGGEFQFATASNKFDEKSFDYEFTESNRERLYGGSYEGIYPFNAYGVNLITGFNYYFAKNIYLGVEVGLGVQFMQNKKWKTEELDGLDSDTEESKASSSVFAAALYANPQIRLGWAF